MEVRRGQKSLVRLDYRTWARDSRETGASLCRIAECPRQPTRTAGIDWAMSQGEADGNPGGVGREDPAAARWEHLALTHNGADVGSDRGLSTRIVRLGNEGWELVNVSTVAKDGTTVKVLFFFKRPK